MKKFYAGIVVLALICCLSSMFIGCDGESRGDKPDTLSIAQIVDNRIAKLERSAFLLGACYAQKAIGDPRYAHRKSQYDVAELAWEIYQEKKP